MATRALESEDDSGTAAIATLAAAILIANAVAASSAQHADALVAPTIVALTPQ